MESRKKFRILFVCHGNICRSPMAEFIMKDLVSKEGLADCFDIESAAVSSEEIGNPVYPPVKRILEGMGISPEGKRARKMTSIDYDRFDLIAAMDFDNIRRMNSICPSDLDGKIHLLKEYCGDARGEVADPWYTGDFSATLNDVRSGCEGILSYWRKNIQ